MSLVEVTKVSRVYQMGEVEVPALRDVSLSIEEAAFVSLVGPSGSGKTTLLNLIGCLDRPTAGEITVDGQKLNDLNRREAANFRGRRLGFVFQNFSLIPVLTASENVEYPLIMVMNRPRDEREKAVKEVLEAVGMWEMRNKRPAQLSGGQMQRVAVARALVGRPKLVLADEPTANLDFKSASMVIRLMRKMKDNFGTTFIFSTHDPRIVGEAEVIYRLDDGKLIGTEQNSGRRQNHD